MNKNLQELQKVFGNRVKIDEPMSKHTTFKIGGPAEFYLEVEKIDDLALAVNTARKLKIPFFMLGGGSNIIVSDNGIKGLVIKNNCRRFEVMSMVGKVKNRKIDVDSALVFAQSGVIMNQLVRYTIDEGLGGLEYQLGLPGTVGGAIYMNSNFPKKKSYVGEVVYKVKLLTEDGSIKEVDNSYFNFSYDKSILQETNEIILSVIFKLKPVDKKNLWTRGTEVLNYRNETQPKGISAGCTFRNISMLDAINIPTPDRITSAGYLIDKAGLKGKRIGDAVVSDKHANFILNMGNAKAKDVASLLDLVKHEVFKKFGVKLVIEVKTIGF